MQAVWVFLLEALVPGARVCDVASDIVGTCVRMYIGLTCVLNVDNCSKHSWWRGDSFVLQLSSS